MSDDWELNADTDVNIPDADRDDDDDGFPALLEYAYGLGNFTPDPPQQTFVENRDGFLTLTYLRNPFAVRTLRFTVQRSTDAGISDPWSDDDVIEAVPPVMVGDREQVSFRSTIPASSHSNEFLRLKIELLNP